MDGKVNRLNILLPLTRVILLIVPILTLMVRSMVAAILMYNAGLAILFTANLPRGTFDFLVETAAPLYQGQREPDVHDRREAIGSFSPHLEQMRILAWALTPQFGQDTAMPSVVRVGWGIALRKVRPWGLLARYRGGGLRGDFG